MPKFVADENFNSAIFRGLLRRRPSLDIVRVQDVGLRRIGDPQLLEWAAVQQRLVLTHDVTTLRKFAEDRVGAGQSMPGVFEIGEDLSIRAVIEDLLLIAECSREGEWEGQIRFLPLR